MISCRMYNTFLELKTVKKQTIKKKKEHSYPLIYNKYRFTTFGQRCFIIGPLTALFRRVPDFWKMLGFLVVVV